jgi:repressor LexA
MFSMVNLTKPQRLLADFLQERVEKDEPPPTYREICTRLCYRSPRAAADLVAALEKKGLVTRDKRRARGIRLVQRRPGVPVLGRVAAGFPGEALPEFGECLALDPAFCGIRDRSRAFALRVTGDSMVGRQIFDGDIVLLEHAVIPRNGDVVAALIENESTIKTFVRKNGKAWLHAENPRYPDLIPALDMQVQGVGRAVIRMLSK